ncbi:hypothetical protein I316_05659 [Kwoniella heveanensis BCC8398]|uniref:GH18 domain-containing protein n=1 Tax=Kwoniella heveanensis BCC8398 TaxID=1296120 RepID=A0A1B9GP33_9TREE|nr:hypothetical protein I316_05659 [Kwoniella heveanensis BCC8398]
MRFDSINPIIPLIPLLGVGALSVPRGGIHRQTPRSLLSANQADLQSRQVQDGLGWHGYRSVGYYPNWVIYSDPGYFVNNITAKDFTHIIYAFANVDPDNGNVYLSAPWADTQYPYPGDNTEEPGNNLYGNLKQLFLLKEANRNLKIQLGIGGATYSANFAKINDAQWRQNFADSSIALVNNLGFDGVCLDYGIPTTDQSEALVDLFRGLRTGLNAAASRNGGGHYLLSWAASCGAFNWGGQDVAGMDHYLDYWNLMAYDGQARRLLHVILAHFTSTQYALQFSGSWTDTALPASNLYPDGMSSDVGASGSQCVQHYVESGVTPRKLNLGLPLYATGFSGTQGMWTAWTDQANFDVKLAPPAGEQLLYNQTLGASWSYSSATGHVTSFDTPTVAYQKARWVMNNQVGGMMYWSIDGDYTRLQPQPAPSAIAKRDDGGVIQARCKKGGYDDDDEVCNGGHHGGGDGAGSGGNPVPSILPSVSASSTPSLPLSGGSAVVLIRLRI